jgi:O-antigen/teichoic acid export membrane protein
VGGVATGVTAQASREARARDAPGLIRSAAWMSGAHIAGQAAAYGSLLVLARLIPPSSFGAVAAGTAILYIAVRIMDAGTQGSIVVSPRVSRAGLRRSQLRCLGAGLALSAAIAVGADALARAFAGHADARVMAVLGLGVPIYALAVVPMALLQRSLEFRDLARAWAASNILSAVAALSVGALGGGVWALVTRQMVWLTALASLLWWAGRRLLPPREVSRAEVRRPAVARWFLVFGITQVVTLNLDYLIVGRMEPVGQLGLYALAFMIAFAPVDHFSAHVGKVLVAAAAASGRSESGPRTVAATRMMALLLLPLAPVAVALARPVLPAVLGEKWAGMVVPFQLLVVAGVGYAVLNCIGEALTGGGEMPFRARVNVVWSLLTLVTLVVLVHADGIRGAATAHVVVVVAYAAVYLTAGARRAGTDPRTLWSALRPVVVVVALQAVVTAVVTVGLGRAGAPSGAAASLGAALGLAALLGASVRGEGAPMREMAVVLRAAARGTAS